MARMGPMGDISAAGSGVWTWRRPHQPVGRRSSGRQGYRLVVVDGWVPARIRRVSVAFCDAVAFCDELAGDGCVESACHVSSLVEAGLFRGRGSVQRQRRC